MQRNQAMKNHYPTFSTHAINTVFPTRRWFAATLMLLLWSMASAQTQGPLYPGTRGTITGGINWANVGNIQSDNNVYATCNLDNGETSRYIYGIDYGFAIPAAATITGIQVQIKRVSSSGNANNISDQNVRLVKGGIVQATNYANPAVWNNSVQVISYGGAGDLWGTTWTPAEINANNFGATISVSSNANNRTAYIDYIRITVYYTTTPTITGFNPAGSCSNVATSVTITGTGFSNVNWVWFNGVNATSYTVNSSTQITAVYPVGTGSGPITVNTAAGTATSAANFTVTPAPVVAAITGNLNVCPGATTALSSSTPGGVWSSSNPGIASVNSSSGLVSGLTSGTTTITYTVTSGGCSSSQSATITVTAPPVVSGPAAVCVGNTIQMLPNSGGSWVSNNPAVASISNSGLVTGLVGGNATFTFTSSSTNCSATTAAVSVNTAPAISAHPNTQSVCSGSSVTFGVTASGAGISYQWYRGASALVNGGNISGATSALLTLNNVALADADADYHCVVSGSCAPPATSNAAALTVTERVQITAQPVVSQSLCSGTTANFSVSATGAGLTYQWYQGGAPLVDGGNISGATSPNLSIANLTSANAANDYYCIVSGTSPCNPVTSNNSILIVNDGPGIATHPAAAQTVCAGDAVSFTVVATGGSLMYQWYNGATLLNNGGGISGATSATLTINPADPSHSSTNYHCVVSNGCVTPATSNNAALTVNERPFIGNYTATACSGAAFSVVPINGAPTASTIVPLGTAYSWPAPTVTGGLSGGFADSGQTSIAQTLTNPTNTVQTATYTVTPVSGTAGACTGASFTITVTVNPTPFVANMTDTVCSGDNLTITPANAGANVIPAGTSYSWGVPTVTGGMSGGASGTNQTSLSLNLTNPTAVAQTATYTVTPATASCTGLPFTVVVTVNPKPTVSGSPATQTVCSGDAMTTIVLGNPNAISGTISYSWTRSNTANIIGLPASGTGSSISGTVVNTTSTPQTTTFTLYATSDAGCPSVPVTVDVIVNPVPTVLATPNTQTVCSGIALTTINFSNPNNVSGTTYSWTRNNTANLTGIPASGSGSNISGTLTNNTLTQQTTTFTITATASGCGTNSTTVTVIVNPLPDVAAGPSAQTLCAGAAITPIVISNPNALAGTTFTWTRNNTANTPGIAASGTSGTISGSMTNPTGVDQVTTFTIYTTRAGCLSSPVTVNVTVQPAPLAVATPAAQGVCTGSVGSIALSTSNNVAGTTYSWTRTNTANVTGIAASGTGNISGTFVNNTATNQITTFTIIATAPNGCSRTTTATVTVYATMSTPGIEDSQVVCQGSRPTTFFITTPITGGSGIFTYQWQSSVVGATGPWTPIVGATAATYQPPTTNGATPNTWYQVVVSSCGSSVNSNAVLVVVGSNNNFNITLNGGGEELCSGEAYNPGIGTAHGNSVYFRYSWIADPAYISPASGGPTGGRVNGLPCFGFCSSANFPLTVQNNTNANVTTTISITPILYDADTNTAVCALSPRTFSVTIRPRPTATATAPNPVICSGTSAGISVTSNLTPSSQMSYGWTRSTNANVSSSQGTGNSGTVAVGNSYTIPDVLTNNTSVNQNVTYTITPTSGTGANACPGTPTTITITIAPQLTPGVVGSNQTLCNSGDPVAFTQITAAAGSGLSYQWQSSTVGATGPFSDIAGANGVTYDAPVISQTTWYVRVVTNTINGLTCSVATTTPIQVTVNNIAPGSINGTQTICSGGDPTVLGNATAATGSAAVAYQWQSNTTGCGGTFANIGGATGATYDPPAGLLATTYYRRMATSTVNSTACADYSNCIVVTVNTVTAGTVGSDQTLCGSTAAGLTQITPATGAGTLSYQWQSNTSGCGATFNNIAGATFPTYTPPAGLLATTYYRRVTTSTLNGVSCTAVSNCVTITLNSVTAGSIASNQTICAGGDPVAFTSTAAGSGNALSYVWQISTTSATGPWTDIPGTNVAAYDAPGPINTTTYFRRVATATTNSVSCSSVTSAVTVFVNQVTAPVMAGDQAVCAQDPSAFTISTAATFSGTPGYQWQSSTVGCGSGWSPITGATSATYDPPVVTQTTYYRVVVTSTLNGVSCSATSNCLTITSNAKTWNGLAGTDWHNPTNWTPNGVPTASHCVVIPNTTNKPFVLGSNNNAYAYSLTMLSGAVLEIIPTNTITVTDVVTVQAGASFFIKNNAALVQINPVANVGNIDMERTTQPMYRYDYTYWGSPVTAASGFTLSMLSPQTLFDKYFSWNPTNGGGNGSWTMLPAATVMNPNRGYIVRAPQTYSTNPATTQPYTAHFVGVPNNGNITVPITIGALAPGLFNDKLNLLGNPYPSAVDADLFLNDPANTGLIDGTIYFWTHHSPPSAAYADPFYGNYVYNYTAGDYATYTSLGTAYTVPSGYGGPVPDGYIAAGQGFFVKGLASGNAVFRNDMRVSGNNSAFFRPGNAVEKHRIWLNLANTQGGFSQALVGYAEGATMAYDRGLDGSAFAGNFVSFYSLLEDQSILTVQGRPLPFDVQDVVPMGYNATAANTYTIGIDRFDGLFAQQNIYLEDKLLGIIHDLKASAYSFTSNAGRFDDRFVLRYTNSTLSTPKQAATNTAVAFVADGKLSVQTANAMKAILLFDLTGKHIATYKPDGDARKLLANFPYAQGVYLMRIETESGVISQKLMNQ